MINVNTNLLVKVVGMRVLTFFNPKSTIKRKTSQIRYKKYGKTSQMIFIMQNDEILGVVEKIK